MTAVRPPAITKVALPSLRSRRSWRTFDRRLACEKVVSVPRQSVSTTGHVIETTIVPRWERGFDRVGCGEDVSLTDEPPVSAGVPVPPPLLCEGGVVGTTGGASSSAMVAMPVRSLPLAAAPLTLDSCSANDSSPSWVPSSTSGTDTLLDASEREKLRVPLLAP